MRRILLLFVGLLFFVNLFAQNWDWALHIESTGDNTEVVDVVRDGNYLYTYGIFRGTLTLGGIDYASVGNNDLYLVKTNLDGEVQWVRIAGSSGNELASHVRVDESHNVYISGGFQNNCDFDGQNIISSDGFDGFIAKYDSGGTIQWARNIAWGTGNDRITGMAVDNDGTVFVTGLFINDVVIGDVSTNDTYNAGTDPRRMFVASFNTDASYNWSVEFANTGSQTIFRALTLAEDNSIYVGGANNGTITIGGNGYTTRGSGDIILVKLSSSGVPQWVRTAGGGGTSDDQLNSIVDFDNNVYIIGYVQNTGNIDQNGVDPPLSYSASSVDIITARYNSEGSLIWHTVIGGAGADSGYGIQIHENIMVCSGYFSSNVTFNDDIIASGGGFDAGFFVFDLDGNPITASSVSGTLEDRGQAVIYDGVGNTYIGGFFKSSNLSIGSLDLLSNAYSPLKDGFLAKYQNPFSATFTTKKNVSCSGGSDGELTVTTYFGTEPYTYSWTKDGSAYGSDTHTLTNLSAGVYEVTVTDANTKEASTTYTITQPTAITAGTPDITNVTCFGGDDGAIDIHPSGGTGTLTYFWTTDDGFGLETTTQDQTGLIAGTYCVCITDANGCEFTDSYTLTDPDEIVITGSVTDITNPGSNGAITISDVSGGTGTYPDDFSFSWVGPNSFTSSDEDIIGLSDAGEYSVTVTDGVGCSQDKTYSVVDEQQFSIWISSKTNVLCNGNSTGSATVSYFKPTGFPDNPIAYSWTLSGGGDVLSSDATVAGLLAGTYKVVVNYDDDNDPLTDNDHIIDNIQITQPTAITGGVTPTAVSCYNGSNGVATLSVSGGVLPYSYVWKDGSDIQIATSKDITGRIAGNYTVYVKDANLCEASFPTTITQPDDIVITIAETPVTCYGESNGELSITDITGGNGGYTQVWSNTLTSSTITNLKAGNYSVTVTDSKRCKKSKATSVSQPNQITATFTVTEPSCNGGSNGRIDIIGVAGGSESGYEFSINSGSYQSNNYFISLTANSYIISIRDDAGCSRSFNVNVGEPSALSVSHLENKPTCPESTNGSISLTVSGGTGAKTYFWTGPSITEPAQKDQSGLGIGDYSVRVTDENSCYLDYPITLESTNTSPNVYDVTGGGEYCSGSDGVAVGLDGSQSGVNYQLRLNSGDTGSPIPGTGSAISFGNQTGVGTYTVVATNATTGCTIGMNGSAMVSIEATPVAGSLTKDPNVENVCEGITVSASLTAGSGGNGVDELQYRTYDGSGWSDWQAYTSGTDIQAPGVKQVQIHTRRLADYCSPSAFTTVSWVVEETPSEGVYGKTPNQDAVCEGIPVSATLSASSGGNGVDKEEFRTFDGTSWSSWANYTSGNLISTSGNTRVEIRSQRLADYCSPSGYVTVIWDVESTPNSGNLTKTPDAINICEGTPVSATLSAGSGGNGVDELESRTDGGAWASYNSGGSIPTTGVSTVEIRTRRTASYCSSADYNTVSWTVEATPVPGTLAKSPDATHICEGIPVSATLTAGTGGNGVDELEFRTNGGAWASYTSGSLISTTGLNSIDIRTRRTADYCSDGVYNTVTWGVDPPTVGGSVSGEKTVCYGSTSGVLTLSGHTGIVLRWESSANTTSWNPINHSAETYTSGNLTQTTHFRAVVKSGVCDEQASDFVTIYVDPATVGGSVSGGAPVCEGELSPELSLSGHVGLIVRWESSVDGSIWSPIVHTTSSYTPGILSSTTQYRAVVQSGVCEEQNSLSTTITVNPLPTVTAPADFAVCAGDPVTLSGTGNANTYTWDNGVTNGEAFTPTETKVYTVTGIITATGCQSTDQVTVTVNPLPTVTAPADFAVCAGESVTLSGTGNANTYTWDNSVTNGEAFTPTETITYTVTGTITATGCQSTDQVTVTVNPLPTVTAPADFAVCAGDPVTLSGTGNANTYTWDNGVTNGLTFTSTVTKVYTVTGIITATGCQSTDQVTVTVNPLPTVTAPADFAICAGEEVTLIATGDADNYTWDNSVIDGLAFTPTETTTYTVTGTITATGCQSTDQVTVTVNPLPTVTAPADFAICAGEEVTLTATGTADTYTWDNDVTNGVAFAPAATQIYTVTGTITATGCQSTDQVTVTVNPLPIVTAPADFAICAGEEVTLIATGDADSYTWDNSVIDGLAFTPTETTTYTVTGTITATGCQSTDQVTVTVNPLPTVTAPADFAICAGEEVTLTGEGTADTYTWNNGVSDGVAFIPVETKTYTVTGVIDETGCESSDEITIYVDPQTIPGTVSGGSVICSGGVSELLTLEDYVGIIVQWEKAVAPFDTWIPISNTSSTYTSGILTETTRFRAVVKSGVCDELPSEFTEVEVIQSIGGEIIGESLVCHGTTSGLMTLQDFEGAILRWQYNDTGDILQWNNIPGTEGLTSYESSLLTKPTAFRVRVKNGSCATVNSEVFNVDIEPLSVGGEVIGGSEVCVGQTSEILTLTGNLGDVLRWESSVDNGDTWVVIAHTGTSFSSAELSQTTMFRAVVKNGVCNEVASDPTTVIVNPYPVPVVTNTSSLSVCASDLVSVGLTVDIADAISYQWLLNGLPIQDATAQNFTAIEPGIYSVEVDVKGCLGTSNELEVVIVDNPEPLILTDDLLFYCQGENISVELSSSIADADTYQWLLNNDPIQGANSSTYLATQAGIYSLGIVVNGCIGLSDEIEVVVNPLPVVNAPADFEICAGESITLAASGNASEFTWSNGVEDGVAFTPVETKTYTVTGEIFETGCTSSADVKVTVKPLPQPIINSQYNLNVCAGDEIDITFNVDIEDADAYQWLLNGQPIDGATADIFVATQTGDYSVEVTVNGCVGTSNVLSISIIDRPDPVVSALSNLTICEGEAVNVDLTVSISNADSYQWLLNGLPVTGANSKDYTATLEGLYAVEVIVNGCSAISNELLIAITEKPNPVISTLDRTTFYEGEVVSVTLDVDIDNADAYQWLLNGDEIADANQPEYQANQVGTYSVLVTVDGCSGVSNEIEIVQVEQLLPTISTNDPLTWCEGEAIVVNFEVSVANADSYQWYRNDAAIENAQAASYIANLNGEYKVEVTLGEETAFSNMLVVSVTPKPTPVISTTDPLSWCTGTSISVDIVAAVTDATAYQWMLNDVDIDGATSANYTAESPGEYSVRVVVNGCEGESNSIVIVEDDELHPIISALSATELCEGDEINVTLTVDISSADSYQWKLNGNDIENATQSTYVATQAGAYSVELIAGACSGISNVVVIEVNPLPQPVLSTDDKFVWGDDETIAVTFTVDIDDADAYQWLLDGSPIANAVSNSFVANQPGEYSVIVTVANCEGESNKLKVEVSSTPHFTVTFSVQNTSGAPVEGAEITVTGYNPIVSSASGVATIQLPDGSYSIVVKKTDFNDYSSDLTVDGQDKAVSISLIAVSAPVDELTQISLYPNPFNHEIRISNPQIVSRAVITNMAGQKVMEVQLDGQDRIYTQVLPSGVYLLRLISTDGRSAIFRMVKEK